MKKIMFNDKFGLTKAVLEGRKTMTRRIAYSKDILRWLDIGYDTKTHQCLICDGESIVARSQYHVGEIVAVAQSYNQTGLSPSMYCEVPNEYGGTRDGSFDELAGWENKMFVKAELMPHHIKITNIRVERLQDISNEDCIKEGIERYFCTFGIKNCMGGVPILETYCLPREAFAALIDKMSGIGTWDSNPIVWVYQFELLD